MSTTTTTPPTTRTTAADVREGDLLVSLTDHRGTRAVRRRVLAVEPGWDWDTGRGFDLLLEVRGGRVGVMRECPVVVVRAADLAAAHQAREALMDAARVGAADRGAARRRNR